MQLALVVQFSAVSSLLQGREAISTWRRALAATQGCLGGTQVQGGGHAGVLGLRRGSGAGWAPLGLSPARGHPCGTWPAQHQDGPSGCGTWAPPKNLLLQLGGSRAPPAWAGWDVGSPDTRPHPPAPQEAGHQLPPGSLSHVLLACPCCRDARGCPPPGGPPRHRATAKEMLYWGVASRGGGVSARGPTQLPPPQYVEVQMVDGLGAMFPVVDHCRERDGRGGGGGGQANPTHPQPPHPRDHRRGSCPMARQGTPTHRGGSRQPDPLPSPSVLPPPASAPGAAGRWVGEQEGQHRACPSVCPSPNVPGTSPPTPWQPTRTHLGVLGTHAADPGNGALGDHQEVDGGLGGHIAENQALPGEWWESRLSPAPMGAAFHPPFPNPTPVGTGGPNVPATLSSS